MRKYQYFIRYLYIIYGFIYFPPVIKVTESCIDCAAPIEVSSDSLEGEIIGCPDCGLDYVMEIGEQGIIELKQLIFEGEDWGE